MNVCKKIYLKNSGLSFGLKECVKDHLAIGVCNGVYLGFGSESAAEVGLSEKLSLCLMEEVPDGSEIG